MNESSLLNICGLNNMAAESCKVGRSPSEVVCKMWVGVPKAAFIWIVGLTCMVITEPQTTQRPKQ